MCSNDPECFKALNPWVTVDVAAAALREKRTAIRQVVGARDASLDLHHRVRERMSDLRIPHEYAEQPDVGHDARARLAGLGERNGAFYRRALRLGGSGSTQ